MNDENEDDDDQKLVTLNMFNVRNITII
jgi:hypothetical protein